MSKFSIYFIYIVYKTTFKKKMFWSRFCTDFLQINTLSKNRSQKCTQVILNISTKKQKTTDLQHITKYFYKNFFHLYQVVSFDHCGCKKNMYVMEIFSRWSELGANLICIFPKRNSNIYFCRTIVISPQIMKGGQIVVHYHL
jgi:hypothetical protein